MPPQPQQQQQAYGGNKKFSGGYRRTRDSGLDDKAEEAISLGECFVYVYVYVCMGGRMCVCTG